MLVLPWFTFSTPPTDRPRNTKYVASVTMKLGSPDRVTTSPLTAPIAAPKANVTATAAQAFQCSFPTSSAMMMAQNPVIPPVDRSNSPPIISSPTGTAMIPKNAACCAQAWNPVCVSHRCCGVLSVTANTTNTATAPSSAPSAGRRRALVSTPASAPRPSDSPVSAPEGPVGGGPASPGQATAMSELVISRPRPRSRRPPT